MHITNHFKEKCDNRKIYKPYIIKALHNYNIIEFNCDKGCKVVIRSTVNDKYNLCMSIDIINNSLVTIWINSTTDNHRTIDMSNYNNKIDIKRVIEVCKINKNNQ